MLERLFSWEVVSPIVALLVAVALAVLPFNDFRIAKTCFYLAALDAAGGIIMWGVDSKSPRWIVAFISFVGIGGLGTLLVLGLRYIESKKPVHVVPASSVSSSSSGSLPFDVQTTTNRPLSLKEYYLTDFYGNTLGIGYAPGTMERNSGEKITYEARLLIDPQSATKFAAFYLPNTPYAIVGAQSLAMNVLTAAGVNNMHFLAQGAGNEPLNSKDYKFSGRVYLYVENFLTPEEKGDLHKFYNSQNLQLEIRDADYERLRNLQRKDIPH